MQLEGKKLDDEESDHKKRKYWRVDCQSASKGTSAMIFTRAHLFLSYHLIKVPCIRENVTRNPTNADLKSKFAKYIYLLFKNGQDFLDMQ